MPHRYVVLSAIHFGRESGDGCLEVKAGVKDWVCMIEREREKERTGGGIGGKAGVTDWVEA